MAVTRFDTTQVINAGAGAVDITLPGPPIAGDLVVMFLVSAEAFPSSGFNTSLTSIHNTTSASPGYQSRYKVMTATPDTVFNVNARTTDKMVVLARTYRGLDTSTIPDNGAATSATNTSGMPDAPSYTTVTNGALVIAFGGLDDDDVSSSVTAPSGYGNLLKADTGQGLTASGATAMIADKIVTTAGAEDPAAFGGTGTDAWRAATWAVRVSASGIDGAAAITEAGDTVASAGTVAIAGAAAITEAADTVAGAGAVSLSGAAAITEAGDTLASAGTVAVSGAAAVTEADDTLAAEGSVVSGVSGAAAITEADDSLASAATVAVAGAASVTEAGDTLAATGAVPVSGAAAVTEGADTLAAEGLVADEAPVLGAADITEADDTLEADGVAAQPERVEPPFPQGGGGTPRGASYQPKRPPSWRRKKDEPEVTVIVAEPDGEKTTFEIPAAELRPALPDIAEIMGEVRRDLASRMVLRPNDDDEALLIMQLLAELED